MTTTCMLNIYSLQSCVFMFAIWKIPPATLSNGKQNIQFQNKIDWQ